MSDADAQAEAPVKLDPDRLMDHIRNTPILKVAIISLVLHVVVIGLTSVPFIISELNATPPPTEEQIQAKAEEEAAAKAKAAEEAAAIEAAKPKPKKGSANVVLPGDEAAGTGTDTAVAGGTSSGSRLMDALNDVEPPLEEPGAKINLSLDNELELKTEN